MTIKEIQEEIIDEFSMFDDWMERYEYIIELGKSLPIINDDFKLEENLIKSAMQTHQSEKAGTKQPIDNLVYKSFVKNFNEKYHGELNESQKKLMTKFVTSFADGGLELKMFLNEEIGELKSDLREVGTKIQNEDLKGRISEVVLSLEGMAKEEITNGMVEKVLKVQQLKEEIESYVS